jgi:hypothetical protein
VPEFFSGKQKVFGKSFSPRQKDFALQIFLMPDNFLPDARKTFVKQIKIIWHLASNIFVKKSKSRFF